MFGGNGAPGRIRTPNLLIRSQTLYPIELRAHIRATLYRRAAVERLHVAGPASFDKAKPQLISISFPNQGA